MATLIPFQVYVQALGGKFLGPNAYNNMAIRLSLALPGELQPVHIPYVVTPTITNDGNISGTFTDGATSFMPILTMPATAAANPAVNYLTPDANTIAGNCSILLPAKEEQAVLTVIIPTPSGNQLIFKQPVLLSPLKTSYKVSIVIPGLLLTAGTVNTASGNISVFVKMMCGCKITQGLATSFWTVSDFEVSAYVKFADNTSGYYTLSFDQPANDSMFAAAITGKPAITHVEFSAMQKSTGNYGFLGLKV
jgi:hypothetical protein